MNLFEKILLLLQGEMNIPTPFGWFHILCLVLVLMVLIFLYGRRKYYCEKQLKRVLGIYGIIAFILEMLKQLSWSFNYDTLTNVVTWDYQWYAFPFQLCSTPIYVCLLCFILKKNKFRNYLLSYIAYITILGSISTMLLPDSCFVSDILVNIHTMWLHLGSFVVSVYLLMSGEVKVEIKSLKKAIVVFLCFVLIAQLLNIGIYNLGVLNGETFDMFYISPYFDTILPVFNIIEKYVSSIIYLIIYVVVLLIGGLIIYLISKFIKKIVSNRKTNL